MRRRRLGFRRKHMWNFLTVRREQMEAVGMYLLISSGQQPRI